LEKGTSSSLGVSDRPQQDASADAPYGLVLSLAEVIEDNELGPVLEALESVLFTNDTDQAADL
jgi:hypothetical protein